MPLIPDQLRLVVEDHPDAIAYRVVDGATMTFREWESAANRVARGLLDAGVGVGDRVALLLDPDDAITNLQSYIGVHKAGAVNVPINARLSRPEVGRILGHSEPTVVVASATHAATVRELAMEVPSIRTLVSAGDASDGVTAWSAFLADDDTDVQADISDESPADILYTSGTTGAPKGVVARHKAGTTTPIGKPEAFSGMLWLHASPMFTFAGVSFIIVPMRLGLTGVYMPKFDARRWLEFAESEPVVMAFLVPAMVELLIAHEEFEQRDLSSIFMVSVGSAPSAPATLQALQRQLPQAAVSNSYSMTEAGSAFCVLPKGELERRPGSVGIPMPPLEIRIVAEDGAEVPTGDVGEVVMRNVGKEREYYKDPDATASTWNDGWLQSGDLGKLDGDGYLYIVGRAKDVIIRGGNNIHAMDVEAVIYEHPDVLEAAVVGIPHPVLGEDVAAFVVPKDGVELTGDDVKAWCESRLADYKRPRRVEVVASLPRNAMGKVLKRDLQSQLAADLAG